MTYWEGPYRWINTALLFILGFILFDALFMLLPTQDSNPIVAFVGVVAGVFLTPFQGMFVNQPDLVTSAIAVLGYCLLTGIVLAVLASVAASRRDAALRAPQTPRGERLASPPERSSDAAADRTRRL